MNLNEQSTNGRAATRAATPNPILQRSEPPQSRHTTMEDLSAPAEQDPLDDMTLPTPHTRFAIAGWSAGPTGRVMSTSLEAYMATTIKRFLSQLNRLVPSWLSRNSNRNSHYRPFAEAREYVRSLGLTSVNDWQVLAKSGQRPTATLFRAARRCIRVYCALLHGQHPETVDLSSLSAIELAVLREMVIEMYDSYPFMEVGNCVLFIDDAIHRREGVT